MAMAIKYAKFAEKTFSTIDKLYIHIDEIHKNATQKHEDKNQDEKVHKTSPLTKLQPSSQLAEVDLSDEFDSSSDIHEEKFICRECDQTFSTESNLNFHLST